MFSCKIVSMKHLQRPPQLPSTFHTWAALTTAAQAPALL